MSHLKGRRHIASCERGLKFVGEFLEFQKNKNTISSITTGAQEAAPSNSQLPAVSPPDAAVIAPYAELVQQRQTARLAQAPQKRHALHICAPSRTKASRSPIRGRIAFPKSTNSRASAF
ncbi:hypothetical protein BDK51DRAFT_36689 [Blyttiomyces helicus]|uniref:Uncharacterized protein n=1 Tax=Blyttiomyces helicus TaxID=388810 RepID=A0A4P9WG15_9FUNG|nr:hypothetical protein BDK51DRAFT_36689 [Blyttiomyces helicus]|eukprot:RKO90835.1 hypothetical protein BDK51DRAFT_36689 [Blyttiomyces helicus]